MSGIAGGGVIDDKIYVNVSGTTALYEYNPFTTVWTDYSPILAASSQPFAAAVDNKLYFMGGWDGSILSSVQEGVLVPVPGAVVLAGLGLGA
jgi:outer membrane protein assembly factor BamB